MSETIGSVVDRDSITAYALTATGGTPGTTPLVITTVLGGLGRVVLGQDGRPAQVVRLGPVYEIESVPGVTGVNDNAALGPVDDEDRVPSGALTATGGTT